MSFDSLPTELKLNIFEELYFAGTADRQHSDLTKALRVCKEWNTLGASLLWTYLAINNNNLAISLLDLFFRTYRAYA